MMSWKARSFTEPTTNASPPQRAREHEAHEIGPASLRSLDLEERGLVGERRDPDLGLEVTVEVRLASIPDKEAHRLDFFALADQVERAVQPDARQVLVG